MRYGLETGSEADDERPDQGLNDDGDEGDGLADVFRLGGPPAFTDQGPDPMDALRNLSAEGSKMISLYREKPSYAAGRLEAFYIDPGETIDLDAVQREWGGGTFRFRPHKPDGRFEGGSVSVRLAGPALFRGVPVDYQGNPIHPVRAPSMGVIDTVARPTSGAPVTRYGAEQPAGTEHRAMDMLGHTMERILDRLDRLEERAAQPNPQTDPMAQLTQSIAVVKKLQGMFSEGGPGFGGFGGLDDDDDEPAVPSTPQLPTMDQVLPMLLMSQMQQPQHPGPWPQQQPGPWPQQQPPHPPPPQQQPRAPMHFQAPPRQPQAPQQGAPAPGAPAAADIPAGLPPQIAALLASMPPEQRAALIAQYMPPQGNQ